MNIVDVNKENISERGFFCYMSKRKSEGYKRKMKWLEDRFNEGIKIKMLDLEQGGRGFIEYIPGEFAWRAVNAEDYLFIHCVWVAGQSKGKGCATLLLNECVEDAKKSGMKGVAVVTSEGNWLVGKKFFLKHGFESADQHPPFELMVKKFSFSPSPSFSGDFEEKLRAYSKGLTIVHSDQCPYIVAAVNAALDAAKTLGIKANMVEFKSSKEVRQLSPSPYGVFSLVCNGKLISYHSLAKKELMQNLRDNLCTR